MSERSFFDEAQLFRSVLGFKLIPLLRAGDKGRSKGLSFHRKRIFIALADAGGFEIVDTGGNNERKHQED